MNVEGQLNIRLRLSGSGVEQVVIRSSRRVDASRVLEGKTTQEALTLLPLLFSVCGMAQAVAGARACESATSRKATPEEERLRGRLVAMETLREHLWRIFLDWPRFLGAESDRDSLARVVALQRDYTALLLPAGKTLLDPAGAPDIDTGSMERLLGRMEQLLETRVFGRPPRQWLEMTSPEEFHRWLDAHDTLAASYLAGIRKLHWESVGASEVCPLPRLDPERLRREMEDDDFLRAPLWEGRCRETSPLTRVHTPLMQALRSRYGEGLLSRAVARLTEVARITARFGQEDAGEEPFVAGSGVGQIGAARGQLAHSVTLDGEDRVARYRILAPTEWNFHPRGNLAQGLSTLSGDRATLEEQAHQLIHAVDPCVDYRLVLEEAARQGHA